ncbi:unnamed protein product [Boreogadus saida]
MYRWSGPGGPLRGSTGQQQSAEGQLYHIFVPIYWGRGLRSDGLRVRCWQVGGGERETIREWEKAGAEASSLRRGLGSSSVPSAGIRRVPYSISASFLQIVFQQSASLSLDAGPVSSPPSWLSESMLITGETH